jgi:hypothetical protein
MADGSYGQREIDIDLTVVAAARVVRDASKNEWVKIRRIVLNGNSTAGAAVIFRKGSASGPIVANITPTAGIQAVDIPMEDAVFNGLYIDSFTAWTSGHCIIYTA